MDQLGQQDDNPSPTKPNPKGKVNIFLVLYIIAIR